MDKCIDSLEDTEVVSMIDANSGYSQLKVDKANKKSTALSLHQGICQIFKLLISSKTAPATFLRVVEIILHAAKRQYAIEHLVDIAIVFETRRKHIAYTETALTLLKEACATLRPKKYVFSTNHIGVRVVL